MLAIPANSAIRRMVKRAIGGLEGTSPYRLVQAGTAAWDIRTGAWYEPELDLVPVAIQPGEWAIDIGANVGLWTYHLSRAVGPTGRVLAFEPVPATHATLRMVCKLLGVRNADMFPVGCGERTQRLAFTAPLQESGVVSSGLAHLAERRDPPTESTGAPPPASVPVWCEVVALDRFLPRLAGVSLVKCDIEGAELLAFRGAEQLIVTNLPTVACEITADFIAGFGYSVDDLTAFFFGLGYRWYHYDGDRHPQLSEVGAMADFLWHNYLFIHPSRLDRFQSLLADSR